MFSPYYAWSRMRRSAEAHDHCAINVAVYGEHSTRWSMTERGRTSLHRSADELSIGPSAARWDGSALTFEIDEICAPIPRRIRGTVRVSPHALFEHVECIDAQGHHRWTPIAPAARIEVALDSPALRWSGEAYLDANAGDEPVEDRLRSWHWARARVGSNTAVIYDVLARSGEQRSLALAFSRSGDISTFAAPLASLPATRWRIQRTTRADDGVARIVRTLEDTPFYARSLVAGRLLGAPATAVHESLDLDRLRRPIVRAMLPFRMPRRR